MNILLTLIIGLTADSSAIRPTRILFFGDLMMAGMDKVTSVREDSLFPFRGTMELIDLADVAIANLECPFGTKGTPVEGKEFTFLASPRLMGFAKAAGFDGFGLANNHIMDFGPEALEQTLSILDSLGLKHCGAGMNLREAREPMIFDVNGRKIAVFAYSNTYPQEYWATSRRPGTAYGSESYIAKDIRSVRDSVDFVVAFFHWGTERLDTPKTYQRRLAHRAIDSGADLVIGSHPHVVQGVEIYKGKPIFYSLGNYAFRSRTNSASGMAVMAELWGDSTVYHIIPLEVRYRKAFYSPYPDTTGKLLQHIQELSSCNFEKSGFTGRIKLPREEQH